MKTLFATLLIALCLSPAFAAEPSYGNPGHLEQGAGSGVAAQPNYYPDLRFPLERAPAFLNSQVYRWGGGLGPSGDQCDTRNYNYPWGDTFCEKRSRGNVFCSTGKGHQGVDIRPATCKRNIHWAVAAADGVISNIGTYSVTLQTPSGTVFRYLHLYMADLAVSEFQAVKKGEKIGKVSSDFGGTPTTIHLHFEMKDFVVVQGQRKNTFLPPYVTLKAAYERLLN